LALLSGGLTRKTLKATVIETAGLTGMIFFILIGAALFNSFLESTQLPQLIIRQTELLEMSQLTIMLLILVFYLVLGCFMDSISMILLTVPLITPVVAEMGYDLIWFGIMVVTVAEVGLITPPVGMNLFVVQATVPGLWQATVIRGLFPFVLADIVRLLLLLAFPALALWMPSAAP
jgi:TRAP-type C4-dicarboxylate transport system permease large subunit